MATHSGALSISGRRRSRFVEADAPRVTCRRHGVVVVAVPWARHDSRFTRVFEDHVCWLAVNCSKTAVASLMRVAWGSVGSNRGARSRPWTRFMP